MENKTPIIALVDDDKVFQLTASRTIKAAQLTDKILQFENGEDALVFLKNHASDSETLPDYIFLDINMPYVDGWMFLEDYSLFKTKLSKPIEIYMVSSSIDPRDVDRARNNENVRQYIIKPVTREKFIELLGKAAA
ncbi:MAG TPA: response regulator [Ohtaekwangia sp.]|uniref:response regulator n=1 Tax=Ohtaekwangia sp. TaxID=2066019 RepID=UPI002F92BCD0